MRSRFTVFLATVMTMAVAATSNCGFQTPDKKFYDLLPLKKMPTDAYRVFDNDHIFTFNMCDHTQCGVMQDAPACKSPATPSNPPTMNDFEGIASAVPVAQSLTPMDGYPDIADSYALTPTVTVA